MSRDQRVGHLLVASLHRHYINQEQELYLDCHKRAAAGIPFKKSKTQGEIRIELIRFSMICGLGWMRKQERDVSSHPYYTTNAM